MVRCALGTVCVASLCFLHLSADEVPPPPSPRGDSEPTIAKPVDQPTPTDQSSAPPAEERPDKLAYTDPADAGPDFKVQGEYTGRVTFDEQEVWYGLQIVAQGEGRFDVVIYQGGLPGNDWDGKTILRSATEPTDGGYRFGWGDAAAELSGKTIVVKDALGEQIGRLTKVRRRSRTLGRTPPEGAVVLFDGSSVDALEGAEMTEDGLLVQGFQSRETFGDFVLHAEFRTPFMPYARGQARGNSGIYMQGRYETQVLDSFGLEGKDNESGGIYEISDPAINVCFPPLSWQTYDVEFTSPRFDNQGQKTADARMTVKLNGVLVQNDVPVPRATRAAILEESDAPGPLYVQDHGNPVRYRNIWIVRNDPAPTLPPAPASPAPSAVKMKPEKPIVSSGDEMPQVTEEWISLFDGKTLKGWHTNPEKIGHGTGGRWTIEDGTIVGEQDPPGSGNGGILLTDQLFKDFELSIEMKPDWGVCSGLFLRGHDTGKCFQMMVDYHDAGNVGHIYGEGVGGFTNRPFSIFADDEEDGQVQSLRTESTDNVFEGETIDGETFVKAWKVDDWNKAVVRVLGQPPVITTWINGVKVTEVDFAEFRHPKYDADVVAESLGDVGRIAVQVHGGDGWPVGAKCRWRNIFVNPLD